eukprot:gene5864-4186_t
MESKNTNEKNKFGIRRREHQKEKEKQKNATRSYSAYATKRFTMKLPPENPTKNKIILIILYEGIVKRLRVPPSRKGGNNNR